MTVRCQSRAPRTPLPAGLPLETAMTHPRYAPLLEPSAQCELDQGHGARAAETDGARRHRNGCLLWWDPAIVVHGAGPR